MKQFCLCICVANNRYNQRPKTLVKLELKLSVQLRQSYWCWQSLPFKAAHCWGNYRETPCTSQICGVCACVCGMAILPDVYGLLPMPIKSVSLWVGCSGLPVCLFVCLFVCSITQKWMIPKCSNLV